MKSIYKVLFFVLACITSTVLIFSIPIINMFVHGNFGKEKTYTKTEIKIVSQEKPPEPPKPKETAKKPSRMNANNRTPKAGPRFAMNLDVVGGSGGAVVPSSLAAAQSGGGSLGSGDVDEKPILKSAARFLAPQAIRDSEINAILRISFCVNTNGRPYDLRVLEENPAGKGLGNAGRDAIMAMSFAPAKRGGTAVAFCGMEQPFEVKFRE